MRALDSKQAITVNMRNDHINFQLSHIGKQQRCKYVANSSAPECNSMLTLNQIDLTMRVTCMHLMRVEAAQAFINQTWQENGYGIVTKPIINSAGRAVFLADCKQHKGKQFAPRFILTASVK